MALCFMFAINSSSEVSKKVRSKGAGVLNGLLGSVSGKLEVLPLVLVAHEEKNKSISGSKKRTKHTRGRSGKATNGGSLLTS